MAHGSKSSHEGDRDLHNHFEVMTVVNECVEVRRRTLKGKRRRKKL
jgi:hypothetical protein